MRLNKRNQTNRHCSKFPRFFKIKEVNQKVIEKKENHKNMYQILRHPVKINIYL